MEEKKKTCAARRVHDNEPCGCYRDLDALGYCDKHSPLALQCRGIAAKTDERCRIKWKLDRNVLCKYHGNQVVRCHGTLTSGQPCWSTRNVNRHGFCSAHPARAEDLLRDFALLTLAKPKAKSSRVTSKTKSKTTAMATAEEEKPLVKSE